MVNIIIRKSKDIITGREQKQIREVGQQPLDESGYTNPLFDKYGTDNPFKGTDRDRSKRKKYF